MNVKGYTVPPYKQTMTEQSPDILVLRQGEERLSMKDYQQEIQKRLPNYNVQFGATPDKERILAEGAQIITGGSLRDDILEAAPSLRLFAGTTSGYTHLPLEKLREKNIAATNASGTAAPGIAEQAIGNMLVFSRNIHKGWLQKQTNQWSHYQASELQGSTVTVIGLGSIGLAVARRLQGFGVDTIGIRYTPSKGGPTDEVYGFDKQSIHSSLARSQYVVISCPLSETTKGLLSEDEFDTLPPEAVVINMARGGIIKTDQLAEAIQTGKIRGAALDVTDPEPLPNDHPLWSLDDVLITPHMAGHTPYHWERLADILENNVRTVEETGEYTGLENQIVEPSG